MATATVAKELKALFERDLDRLRAELDAYDDEKSLWVVSKDIKNPAGNLMLHICGNLKHYIGATLNNTGYVRDRDLEFSGRSSRADLRRSIDDTKAVLTAYFDRATPEDLAERYPFEPFDYPMTTSHFLIHLYGHLHYHLGQVNYHRRMI